MSVADAIFAFLVAAAISATLTPLTSRLALRVGAVDEPRERGLSIRATPLLGGLAIFAGAAVAGLAWLPGTRLWHGVLIAAAVITVIGALDDRFDLSPAWKLAGQTTAAFVAVRYGVVVHHITLPFVGRLDFPHTGAAITLVGLVGLMNIVNFSDGVDGLAAGVSVIIALTFAVIAFDLHREASGVLAALTAGSALGFLFHNFPPARSFMGDCGSNLLGLLMGCVTVEAAVKTEVVVSFALPLVLLAVPFLDTTFVLLKRLKYRRPIYRADTEHFHHRMARIGFSQRRTVAYLYAWTGMLAGLALALRFFPYSDHHGHLHLGGSLVMVGLILIVGAASVYLVYVLEILKFRRLTALRLRRAGAPMTEAEIEAHVAEQLETGEFEAARSGPGAARRARERTGTSEASGPGSPAPTSPPGPTPRPPGPTPRPPARPRRGPARRLRASPPRVRVAIIADTHLPRGARTLPDACVARLAQADLILHAGDFVAASVLGELEALGPPVCAVHGNVDDHDLRRRLPQRRLVDAGGVGLGLIHDAGPARGRLERLRALFPKAQAVVFGHSHVPLHERDADFQIFNPGSPTDRRRQPAHTMGMAYVAGPGRLRFEHVVLE